MFFSIGQNISHLKEENIESIFEFDLDQEHLKALQKHCSNETLFNEIGKSYGKESHEHFSQYFGAYISMSDCAAINSESINGLFFFCCCFFDREYPVIYYSNLQNDWMISIVFNKIG